MRKGRLCRRRYVRPKDPRTPAQQRARAVFGAASKAWSSSEGFTEEQRQRLRAAGAKVRSRPRLAQSGPLTGQQFFVGKICARGRLGREIRRLLAEGMIKSQAAKKQRGRAKGSLLHSDFRKGKAAGRSGRAQPQRIEGVARSTWESRRGCSTAAPGQHRRVRAYAGKAAGKTASSQVRQYQRVARPTWEHYRSTPGAARWQRRRGTGGDSGGKARDRWKGRWWELRRRKGDGSGGPVQTRRFPDAPAQPNPKGCSQCFPDVRCAVFDEARFNSAAGARGHDFARLRQEPR